MNKKNEAVLTAKISYNPQNLEECHMSVEAEGGTNDLLNCLGAVVTSFIQSDIDVDYIFKAVLKGIADSYKKED